MPHREAMERARAAFLRGRQEEGEAWVAEAEARARAAGRVDGDEELIEVAVAPLWYGTQVSAEAHGRVRRQVAAVRHGHPTVGQARLTAELALVLQREGDPEARDTAERAIGLAGQVGDPVSRLRAALVLCRYYGVRGLRRDGDAWADVAEGGARAPDLDANLAGWALLALALYHLPTDGPRAAALVAQARARFDASGHRVGGTVAAAVAARADPPAVAAIERLAAGLGDLSPLDRDGTLVILADAAGAAGRPDLARQWLLRVEAAGAIPVSNYFRQLLLYDLDAPEAVTRARLARIGSGSAADTPWRIRVTASLAGDALRGSLSEASRAMLGRGVPTTALAAGAARLADRLARRDPGSDDAARLLAFACGAPASEGGRRALEPALRALGQRGAAVPCGPFGLVRPLGAGGMGQVWEGTAPGGQPVAVKLLLAAPAAAEAEWVRTARLEHPHVVPVLGYGRTTVATTWASGDAIPPDTLWYAMPLARGTLAAPLAWPAVHRALEALLQALAHVHARGLTHQDVKPSNLLWTGDPAQPWWWLADFGVARAVGDAARVAGTPGYMAPEQWGGRPWAVGPATDLYAVGCLATELLSGAPPFAASSRAELAHLHRTRHAPTLAPRLPVPAGVVELVASLLEKDPDLRPGSAAAALARLPAADAACADPGARPGSAGPTGLATWVSGVGLEPAPGPEPRPRGSVAAEPLPAEPPEPYRPTSASTPALLGLRPLPSTGRAGFRRAWWGWLGRTLAAGRGAVAWVVGRPGLGARHLVTRLAWSAAEAGAVRVVTVGEDLADAVAAAIGAPDGVPDEERRRALAHAAPGADPDDVLAVVATLARRTPLALVLDARLRDPWVIGALAALDAPVAATVVTRTGADEELPELAAALRGAASAVLPVEPATRDELAELVRAAGPFVDGDVDAIVDASEGLPGAVSDLLRAARDAEAVEVAADGTWSFAKGWRPTPSGTGTFAARLAAERGETGPAVLCLEALGVLHPLSLADWSAVCSAVGAPDPARWLTRWFDRDLVRHAEGGLRPTHPALARLLADAAPRPERLHAAAAAVFSSRHPPSWDRVARHLDAAGDRPGALAAWRTALSHPTGPRPGHASGWLREARAVARRCGLSESDPRWPRVGPA